jgi:hypothetical protein
MDSRGGDVKNVAKIGPNEPSSHKSYSKKHKLVKSRGGKISLVVGEDLKVA